MTTSQNVEVTDAKGSLPVCVTYHVTISYYVNTVSIMPMLNLFGATRPHGKGVFQKLRQHYRAKLYTTSKMFISGSLEGDCDQKAFSTVAGELLTFSERD